MESFIKTNIQYCNGYLARERKKVGGRQPVTSMLLAGFDVPIYSLLCLEAFVAAFIGAVEEKLGCVAHLMLL